MILDDIIVDDDGDPRPFMVLLGLVVLVLVIAIAVVLPGEMVPDEVAVRAMEAHGYHNVQVLERNVLDTTTCEHSTAVKFDVRAQDQFGNVIEGLYVCVGYSSGAAIRSY